MADVSARRTPYPLHDASGALVATHVRVDEPDGGKAVYWVTPDGKKGLDGPLADLPLYGIERVGEARTVVITEGEKAAQALIDNGVMAVGTVTGASATPSARSLGDLTGKNVVLWADKDEVGEEHMLRIAEALKPIALGVWWVTWPEAKAHDDAFDCIERHGRSRALELLRAAGPVPAVDMTFSRRGLGYLAEFRKGKVTFAFDRLRQSGGNLSGELIVRSGDPEAPGTGHLLQGEYNASAIRTRSSTANELTSIAPRIKVDWRDMLEQFCVRVLQAEREGSPFTKVGSRPPRDFVPYLLYPFLPEKRATIVFGEGGSGKSFFAAACAVSISTGRQVLPGVTPVRKGRVLVLDWEADEDEWNDRLAAIARGAGIDEPIEVDYRFGGFAPITDQVESLARYVSDEGIDLIIVDSVGMASPSSRDGSDANDATIRLMHALRAIGTTSLLIDHVSKATKADTKGSKDPYGSVYKTNLARQTFELRTTDEDHDEEASRHIVLVNRKVNNGPRRKPFGLRIDHHDDGAVTFHHENVLDTQSSLLSIPDRIVEFLKTGRQKPVDIARTLGINENSVRPTMKRLVDRGLVLAFPDGSYGLVSLAAATPAGDRDVA